MRRNLGITTYNGLLFDDETPIGQEPPSLIQLGRNPELIQNRDIFLMHRFIYKSRVQRKVYEDILKELSDEVFISQFQISKILLAKGDEILKLKREAITVKELKEKYPHILW